MQGTIRLESFFTFQWFRDSIPNEFRGTFLQRESKHTEALLDRALPPLMNSRERRFEDLKM